MNLATKTRVPYTKFLKVDDSMTSFQADYYFSRYRRKDIITGRLGADAMLGSRGKDRFVYNSTSDSGSATTTAINGFLQADDNNYT